jgi:hypothetical protein
MTPHEFRKPALSFPGTAQVLLGAHGRAAAVRLWNKKNAHRRECLCYCLRKKWKSRFPSLICRIPLRPQVPLRRYTCR